MAFSAIAIPPATPGQTTARDQTPPASSPAASSAFDRPVSWRKLLPNLADDQKQIWTFPARVVQGKNWIPAAAVLGATGALVALDPYTAPYFRRTTDFRGFNNAFSSNATTIGAIAAPTALYTVGFFRKDSKMQRTALLAGQAVADSEILATVLKDATARLRPSGVPIHENFSDTWLDAPGSRFSGHGGFPSGHTIVAFSIATVVARRYGNHRWVPYAAYGAAALVGFSRITLSAHFLSDVFMGGALGYSVSRFAVLRQ